MIRSYFTSGLFVYIVGYHDYGTGFHIAIKEAFLHMTEALRLCASIDNCADLRPLRLAEIGDYDSGYDGVSTKIELNEDLCLFFAAFLFLRLNSSLFSMDTDILLSVDKTKRLTGMEAHKIIRDVLIRGRVSEIKLLPTIESLMEHRLRAQNVFRLWDSAVTGSKAALPAHIDNGYTLTSLKPNTEAFMMMNLGKGYYYGGKPFANLHFVKQQQVPRIPDGRKMTVAFGNWAT